MKLDKFEHFALDAGENAFLRRQLEYIRPMLYEVKYPGFKGRELVPIDYSVNAGAETTSYDAVDGVGQAQVGGGYDNVPPRVDILSKHFSQRILPIFDAYGWSMQEVRAAMFSGRNTMALKGKVARQAIEQKIDQVLLLGETGWGLRGLFTLQGTLTSPPAAGDAATQWGPLKTSAEITKDINTMLNLVVTASNEVHRPTTLVLPLSAYQYLNDTNINTTSNTSILEHFMDRNAYITEVETSIHLEAAPNSEWSGRRAMAYTKDSSMLQGVIPQDFEQLAPQVVNYETVVNCHARIGGIELYYPKSVVYMDNF